MGPEGWSGWGIFEFAAQGSPNRIMSKSSDHRSVVFAVSTATAATAATGREDGKTTHVTPRVTLDVTIAVGSSRVAPLALGTAGNSWES